jgi:hypothetical protein
MLALRNSAADTFALVSETLPAMVVPSAGAAPAVIFFSVHVPLM